jgi:hypothetical protein
MASIPYATAANIQSQSWSLELDSTAGGGQGSGLGKIVQGIGDIHQCLQILFSTIPGEDPWRPTFGCNLLSFLDMPLAAAIPAIVSAVTDAINIWEPRIILEGVQASYSPAEISQLTITVTWQPNLGTQTPTSSTIGLQTTILIVPGGTT